MFKQYTESELTNLIINQIEESIHLDYKGADSLQKADSKKKEISKDVSSFANSDGGTIIYGIREFNEPTRRHLAERIDPVDRQDITKEWLEQVINSNIQPKIQNLKIVSISLRSSENHVAYVVEIPKSNTAHQASDKRYYKRYNFESIAMDDYEIKDILNRQLNPKLQLLLSSVDTTYMARVITFPVILMNTSIKMAKDIKATIQISNFQDCIVISYEGLNDLSSLNNGKKIFGTLTDVSVYKGLNMHIGQISLELAKDIASISFISNIYADNMEPIRGFFSIDIVDGNVVYRLQ